MALKFSGYAAALAGLMTFAAPSMACSLMPTEPLKIKQVMANAVARELGVGAESIKLDAFTEPKLHTPFVLGADCSGLSSYHHTAGFRFTKGSCKYEGVAVLLGYWYEEPVAVNYQEDCSN